jgi:hypothetical protein
MISNNLCTSCEHYQKADGGDEVGVLFERCKIFKTNFHYPVKQCSEYESKNDSMLFVRDAWSFHRNPLGEWKGFPPDADYRVIHAWTGDLDVVEPPTQPSKGFLARLFG